MNEQLKQNTSPTEAEVSAWTTSYGKLRKIEVNTEDEEGNPVPPMRFYFKRNIPNKISMLTLANKKLQENKDSFAYGKIILNAFAVNGQDILNNNEDVLIAVMPLVDSLVTTATAQLGK